MMPSRSAATIASARVDRMASATASDMSTTAPADQIFTPRARTGHSVAQILHPTTFLEACVLLLHNCLNLSRQNTSVHRTRCRCTNGREVKFLTWLRTWLATVGSLKWQHSAILTWRPNLRVLHAGE